MQQNIHGIVTAKACSSTNPEDKSINDLIGLVGEEAVCAAITIEQLEYACNQAYSYNPYIQQQIIVALLDVFASKDPHVMHYDLVRSVLSKIEPEAQNDDQIIDALVREFMQACRSMVLKIKQHKSYLNEILSSISNQYEQDMAPTIIQLEKTEDEIKANNSCIISGLYLWDKIWIEALESTGPKGKLIAKEGETYRNKLINKGSALIPWVNIQTSHDNPFYRSKSLEKLIKALYVDKLKSKFNFKQRETASLVLPVYTHLLDITSPFNECEYMDGKIILMNAGKKLAFSTPYISSELTNVIFRGAEKLWTVPAHRFVRYLINRGFEQLYSDASDPRSLYHDRGCTDIADALGLSGKRAITEINEVMHAFAYMEFKFPHLTGNLYQLSKYRSSNNRLQGIQIILGEPLLPHHVFSQRKGRDTLLIPILADPPIIGPRQYNSSLYSLQMRVVSFFSERSIELYRNKAIYMHGSQWSNLCHQSGLTHDYHQKVLDRWIQDGDDRPKLLQVIDKNMYTLGPTHQKALVALIEQGERRDAGSKGGLKSVEKRKLLRKHRSR